MLLNVTIDEQSIDLQVPPGLVRDAEDLFARMDRDMDGGWQMSREWVDHPDTSQRCQIAADKLYSALENGNRKLALMMAGYILSRLPKVKSVDIDTSGDMSGTRFSLEDQPAAPPPEAPAAQRPGGLSKMDALSQASQEVTKVFKVGRNWRFSVYDQASGQWRDALAAATREEAETLRQRAFKQRFDELMTGAQASTPSDVNDP